MIVVGLWRRIYYCSQSVRVVLRDVNYVAPNCSFSRALCVGVMSLDLGEFFPREEACLASSSRP